MTSHRITASVGSNVNAFANSIALTYTSTAPKPACRITFCNVNIVTIFFNVFPSIIQAVGTTGVPSPLVAICAKIVSAGPLAACLA